MERICYVFGSYYECIEALAHAVAPRAKGPKGKNLVFTEEKTTLVTERAILAQAGGTFNTRVFSMRKFLKTLSDEKDVLSKEGSVMLMRRIVAENAENLRCLGRSRLKSLAPAVYELTAQLKSAKISPEELARAAEGAEGVLADKLADLSLLYAGYEKAAEGKFSDQSNYLARLPALAEKGVRGADVFVAAYASFTRQETDVLESFLKNADSVTAFLVDGDGAAYTGEAVRAYARAVSRAGDSLRVVRAPAKNDLSERVIRAVSDPAARAEKPADGEGKIFLYEAACETEEAEHIAAIIRREVIEGRMRYRDAEVALGALSPHILKKVFAEYEIPFFLDEKRTLSEYAGARLALSLLSCFRRGFPKEEMIDLVRNPFVTESPFGDAFENYLLRFNLSGTSFFKPFRYGADDENFPAFEAARQRVASLFSPLKKRMKAEEFSAAILNAFRLLGAEKTAEETAAALEEAGRAEAAAFSRQAYKKLSAALEEIEKVLGGFPLDIDEFESVLSSGFSADEISVLPQYNDAVYVGDFRETRLVRAKILFLAGMTSAVPAVRSDVAMLSDADLDKLEDLKVSVEPKISAVNLRERENAALAAGAFSERLYVSCSAVGAGGKPQIKSDMMRSLSRSFTKGGGPLKTENAHSVAAFCASAPDGARRRLDAMRYLGRAQAKKAFARELNAFRERERADLSAASAYYRLTEGKDRAQADEMLAAANSEIAVRLKTSREILLGRGLSASLLQSYFSCPYANFLSRGLKLAERREGGAQAADTGNYLHAVFEKFAPLAKTFPGETEAAAYARTLAEEELAGEEYESLQESAAGRHFVENLRGEAEKYCLRIYRQLVDSDFECMEGEARFGRGAKYGAVELSSGKKRYFIEGKVDRIDRFGDYIRVVDYKTGYSDKADKEFYMGKDLQTYLYMNAFLGSYRPAGVYYCSVSDDFVSDGEERAEFSGHTLNDAAVIAATDKKLCPEHPKSALTGIRMTVKKTGEIGYAGGKMLTEKELESYLKYALLVAEKGAERLEEGVIAASPYEGMCAFCPYGGMCPFAGDGSAEERHPVSVTKKTFEEAVAAAEGGKDET